MMPFVTVEVEGGKLTLLGGDEAMREVIEQYSPIERAFRLVFEDLYRHPDGTHLNVYGSVRGRGDNEYILWSDVEVVD